MRLTENAIVGHLATCQTKGHPRQLKHSRTGTLQMRDMKMRGKEHSAFRCPICRLSDDADSSDNDEDDDAVTDTDSQAESVIDTSDTSQTDNDNCEVCLIALRIRVKSPRSDRVGAVCRSSERWPNVRSLENARLEVHEQRLFQDGWKIRERWKYRSKLGKYPHRHFVRNTEARKLKRKRKKNSFLTRLLSKTEFRLISLQSCNLSPNQ